MFDPINEPECADLVAHVSPLTFVSTAGWGELRQLNNAHRAGAICRLDYYAMMRDVLVDEYMGFLDDKERLNRFICG